MDHPSDPSAVDPAAIVASLDLATKVRLLSGADMFDLEGVPDQGLDGVAVADGPHGLRRQAGGGDHLGVGGSQPATCFPTAATLGSTWDADLVARVGEALGAEAAALGVAVVLGPGLNLKRHPAGGRNFEYLSEDPLLSGKLAAAMVRGIQSQGVGACPKHFAVNNQESHRLIVDAIVDDRTLRELYLRSFELVVAESAPWTMMCSYNLVNGTYASEHHELLEEVLRREWGFDGLVMSDWGAVNDRVAGVAAGLDLEMPGSSGAFDAELADAVATGRLDEAAVDRCATRVVELLARARRDRPDVDLDAHHRLGREAAAAGSVLLTNDGTLPLAADIGRIAVIGAFAQHPRYQGAGSSQVNPTRLDTLLDELRTRVAPDTEVVYAPGYDPATGDTDPALRSAAVTAATGADVVVFCGGLPAPLESEGFDRSTLDLPAGQVAVLEAVAASAAPVVVVLSNGGSVHLPWAERVAAVLECWLGGQAGAGGTVDVLFGDADPGGRLAESIPEHVAQLPADRNFPGLPRQVQYREGPYVGYRFHDTAGVPARFPFGHGCSYTTFAWTDVAVTGTGTDRQVSVTVTNTGERAGSDVVQVYLRAPQGTVRRPAQELQGFAKVHLAAGESTTVAIDLDRRSFAIWDVEAYDWLVEAGIYEVVVARSSTDPVDVHEVAVDSTDRPTPEPIPAGLVAGDDEFAALLRRPLPPVPPVRPFHRNSTLEEIEHTWVGRRLGAEIVRQALREAEHEFPDADAATQAMIRTAVREGPARGLALMSGGKVPFAAVDAVIALLNRDPAGAVDAVRRRGRPPA